MEMRKYITGIFSLVLVSNAFAGLTDNHIVKSVKENKVATAVAAATGVGVGALGTCAGRFAINRYEKSVLRKVEKAKEAFKKADAAQKELKDIKDPKEFKIAELVAKQEELKAYSVAREAELEVAIAKLRAEDKPKEKVEKKPEKEAEKKFEKKGD